MLKIGDLAPAFNVSSDSGETVTLEILLAEGPIILFFYPADFTRVCTAEACMFRNEYPALQEVGVRVYGVSPQGAESHQAFRGKHELPYPLLCDPDMAMARAYGARAPLGLMMRRITYLIDKDGRIADRAKGDLRVDQHADFVDRITDS